MQPELELRRSPEMGMQVEALGAFVAPVARNSDAIAEDAGVLQIAEAMFDAFASRRASGGLSRGDLLLACASVCDEATFDSRFELFKRMKLLVPSVAKSHEDRYLFHPYGPAGIAVFDRVSSAGGVDELLTLLDRTRTAIRRGTANSEQVSAALARARGMLVIAADYLLMLVRKRSLEIMIAERHQHQHPSLMSDVQAVTQLVNLRFPDLDSLSYTVILEAQRYLDVRSQFVERLLDEGARAEDFGVLHHEQYLTVAREAPLDRLAQAMERLVFDPVDVALNASAIVAEVDSLRPPPTRPPQPARPTDTATDDDPFQALVDIERRRAEVAVDEAEAVLADRSEVDLSAEMMVRGWPGAARLLVTMLRAAEADPLLTLEFSDSLQADPAAAVSYLSPAYLIRKPVEDNE